MRECDCLPESCAEPVAYAAVWVDDRPEGACYFHRLLCAPHAALVRLTGACGAPAVLRARRDRPGPEWRSPSLRLLCIETYRPATAYNAAWVESRVRRAYSAPARRREC